MPSFDENIKKSLAFTITVENAKMLKKIALIIPIKMFPILRLLTFVLGKYHY